jgi:hypothetical protein
MDKITEKKFIIPPIIFLIFIVLAKPKEIIVWFNSNSEAVAAVLAGGIISIFGLGFLISSITYGFYNLFKYFGWVRRYTSEQELNFWRKIKREKEFVLVRIEKRWDIAFTNFNSATALLIAPLTIWLATFLFQSICFCLIWWWWALWFMFLLIFATNGRRAFKDTDEFENLLNRNS